MPEVKRKNRIEDLIANYNPNKLRDINLKMTIVIKDEEPVYQRARQFSVSKRKQVNKISANKQVDSTTIATA